MAACRAAPVSAAPGGDGAADKSGDVNTTRRKGDFYYAPLVVDAGHGTIRTHLMAEVICRLGFADAHFLLGCLSKIAIVLAPGGCEACPRISSLKNYIDFFEAHWKLASWKTQVNRRADPAKVRDKRVVLVERIILWDKCHGVTVAPGV